MTDPIFIEQAELLGHTDGRDVILLTADGEIPAFYDNDECEPGWISIAGADIAMHVTSPASHYRLPTDAELKAFDDIDRIPAFPVLTHHRGAQPIRG